ncbi:hypothetical protein, partial [uncultured Dialister sp.]|uniref:hypothetical protein n=1 Tax=uncultured Dialister sp. TaxID=278064 RepID=UPI0025CD6499
ERLPYKQNVSSSILLSPTMKKTLCDSLRSVFLFYLPSPVSFNLLHPRFTIFLRVALAPSKNVLCGTSSILLSPTNKEDTM